MAVTVVTRRQARPGQEEALVALLRGLISARPRQGAGPAPTRLFQAARDPAVVLTVSTWDSCEAYWETARLHDTSTVDALCAVPPQRGFYRPLDFDGDVYQPVAAVSSIVVECRPEARQRVLDHLLRESKRFVTSQPGCVLRGLYADEDDPCRLLVLSGWDSLTTWRRFVSDMVDTPRAALWARGARVEPFVEGPTLAELDPALLPP